MSQTTRAIVFSGPRQVRVQQFEMPPLRPHEVRVRIEFSGVSQGTELQALRDERPEIRLPTVPGYQSTGVIEEAGSEVAERGKYLPGQRVLVRTSRLPEEFGPTWMGAHISHAIVPALGTNSDPDDNAPVLIPEGVASDEAALAALFAVSLRGIEMVPVGPGDVAVVLGQGMIGQASAQWARALGAHVIASDLSPERLEMSRACGIEACVDAGRENLSEAVKSLAARGADVVIESSGRAANFDACIDLMREQGHLLLQGWYRDPISFDFHRTHGKRPTVAITCGYSEDDLARTLDALLHKRISIAPLITHRARVEEAPAIYQALLDGDAKTLGVVFDWSR